MSVVTRGSTPAGYGATFTWDQNELYKAVHAGDLLKVEELLRNKVNPNFEGPYGRSLIEDAVGNLEILNLLLEYGANPSFQSRGGWTPLVTAAFGGYADSIRTLIKHGAQPDATDPQGRTPLMVAAEARRIEAVRALLEAGANPSYSVNGLTAIDLVERACSARFADRREACAKIVVLLKSYMGRER